MSSNLYLMDMRTVVPEKIHLTIVPVFLRKDENPPVPDEVALLSEDSGSSATLATWHHRLGHVSTEMIVRMADKKMVNGMVIVGPTSTTAICEPCLTRKQTRINISKNTQTRANEILGRVFSDICGKLPTRSRQGYEYFTTFTDDASRKVYVAGLKLKSDLLQNLKVFIA
jgi:GAG-pre-integrase domain